MNAKKILSTAMLLCCGMLIQFMSAPVASAEIAPQQSSRFKSGDPLMPQPVSVGSSVPGSVSLGGGWYNSAELGDFADVGGGWSWSQWFGYFYYLVTDGNTWLYSDELEWCYLLDGSVASSNWWFWIYSWADWSWTTSSDYPNVYLSGVGSWCWYDADLGDFYNHTSGDYIGQSSGTGHIVDYVIVNTGALNQTAWNDFVDLYSSALSTYGWTNYYQYAYTSNEFVLRYELASVEQAQALRDALKTVVGDYGGIRIELR